MHRHYLKLIIIFLATVMLNSCAHDEASQENQTARVISVKAETVSLTDQRIVKIYTGTLEGEKQAILYAKVAEAVERVNVREGQNVRRDVVLISLDKSGPSSQYQQSKSLYRNAEKNYKKMEYLYKEGAVSESQYDEARTQYEVNKAAFEAAAQLVEIRTPIGGVVTSVDVSPGDFVQVGQKLAIVAKTDRLRVKFGVRTADIGHFKEGSDVFVTSDIGSHQAPGTVHAIAGSADPMTRTFEVEALIDNSEGHFKPGTFVRIGFVQEYLTDVIAAPRRAVLTLEDRQTVFVVANGKAEKRSVTLGAEIDGRVVILSGLSIGDTLVTLGQDYLDHGSAVNITSVSEGI